MDEIKSELDSESTKSGWQLIPRKIIGGIAAMYLIMKAGVALKDVEAWLYFLTIICMTLLGALSIWTHYLLERGSNIKAKKPADEIEWPRPDKDYHPDLPENNT